MTDMFIKVTLPEGYEDTDGSLIIEDLRIGAEWEPEDVTTRVRELEARLEAATDFISDCTRWRKNCWDYDDDMGHGRRDFSDEEDWDILEEAGYRTLCTLINTRAKEDQ